MLRPRVGLPCWFTVKRSDWPPRGSYQPRLSLIWCRARGRCRSIRLPSPPPQPFPRRQLKEFVKAEADASVALQLDPRHVKSLHRRAVARNALGKHRAALGDLLQAAEIDPNSKEASFGSWSRCCGPRTRWTLATGYKWVAAVACLRRRSYVIRQALSGSWGLQVVRVHLGCYIRHIIYSPFSRNCASCGTEGLRYSGFSVVSCFTRQERLTTALCHARLRQAQELVSRRWLAERSGGTDLGCPLDEHEHLSGST